MAISDSKINNFFSKHKVGQLSSLKSKQLAEKNTVTEKALEDHKDSKFSEPTLEVQNRYSDKQESTLNASDITSLANSEQFVSDTLSISNQDVSDKLAISQQKVSKTLAFEAQNVSNTLANSLAKNHEIPDANIEYILTVYSNKEIELLEIIYEKCALNCSNICTIYSKELIDKLAVSTNRVRNLFSRITKKGGIKVIENKRGLDALRIVGISNNLYKKLHELRTNSLANSLANPTYSSSSIINNTTTKTPDTKNLDISLLTDYGFTQEHAEQLLRITFDNAPLKTEVIQNSINYFYYDLKHNNKEKEIKKTPVQFFMGIMRNEKMYNPPKNYKSQSELALELAIEQKKAEQDRMNKRLEEFKTINQSQWLEALSTEEQKKIIASKPKDMAIMPDIVFLKSFYTREVWPKVKEELLEKA
jgi:hypothetical protein